MRIQHNIMAMSAYRNYTNNVSAMKKNLEKLSSGYKINRAGDDAAGLAISEKMRAQITGLETAQKNAKDGISLVQTAEGALTEVHDMLNRMMELATQSANGTYDDSVDRNQMQKEVDQLLGEIDRISKSSNFNGINLLDGSLGLNKAAFTEFSPVDAIEANPNALAVSSYVAAESDGSPAVHMEKAAVSAATPQAVIDLGDLSVTVATGGTATIAISIAGTDYSVQLDNAAGTSEKTFSTSEIADELISKMGNVTISDGASAAASDATGIRIADAVYSLSNAGGKITLTYQGYGPAATYKAETTFSGDTSAAAAINGNLGFDVNVGTVTSGTKTGGVVHKAINVAQAVAKKDAEKAGIDITMSTDMVVDGGTLTIDGKTFEFKTTASYTKQNASATLIDVSMYAASEQVHKASDQLSNQTVTGKDSRTWEIGVNGDGTTIHIAQIASSANGKALDTYEKLTGVIGMTGAPTAAANAGTKITMNAAKIAEGNTLNIDGVKYVFTKDADKVDTTDTKYVQFTDGGADAAQNLVDAINANTSAKTGNPTAELDGTNVIVRAGTPAEGKPVAPMILGKGLTLQIGDTSDNFNQLNVSVQNMNSASIGVGNLDISTEEAAQAAVDKIKAAINTVSDVRGTLGATQNRLDHTINNLSVMTENIQDAESTIRDVDVAEEMMAYTKNNILIQSAQAMLAQANQVPQGVLQLLQ